LQGGVNFAIGNAFDLLCQLAANSISHPGDNADYNIARETLTIVCWAAM